jgi:cell wall-associated NlpC family hydrolase
MNYRDATEIESNLVLEEAKKYIGTDYMKIGQCTGLVCKAIQAVNVHFPSNGPVSVIAANDGLRLLSEKESPRAGDVIVWRGNHMGIYDPNPPKTEDQRNTVLSAMGKPGGTKNKGVAYGQIDWFYPKPPVYMRVRVPN